MKTLLLIALLVARLATGGSVLAVYLATPDTGEPQPGVTLEIEDANGQGHTGTSDAQGIVRFEHLPGKTVWIKRATFQGHELLMDTNDLERGGLHLPLIVGGEQRVQYAADKERLTATLEMPPPAQTFPTNTPEPTRTPRPTPSPTPTDTPMPRSTEAPTPAATATPVFSPTPAPIAAATGAAQATSTPAGPPVAVAVPASAPAAEEPVPAQDRTPQLLLVLGVLAVLGAIGYGVWWSRRRPL